MELQILQLDQDFRTDVLKDLRETEGKVAEFKERVTAAVDQLKRVDIRAPQDGFVNQLAVHTVGGLVGTGETLMQIVPRADALVVEAKVAPQDIDQVAVASDPRLRRPHPRSGHAIGPTLLAVAGYDSKATTLWAAGVGPSLLAYAWLGGDKYRSYDAVLTVQVGYIFAVGPDERQSGWRAQVGITF